MARGVAERLLLAAAADEPGLEEVRVALLGKKGEISLRMRESVAQAAASTFRPADGGVDGDMEAIDERLFDYIGNVFSMVWAPRIDPARQAELAPVITENSGRSVALFGLQRRTLRRATIAGEVPVGIDGRNSRTVRKEKATEYQLA